MRIRDDGLFDLRFKGAYEANCEIIKSVERSLRHQRKEYNKEQKQISHFNLIVFGFIGIVSLLTWSTFSDPATRFNPAISSQSEYSQRAN